MHEIRRFASDEQGATAVEYGLLVAGIALAIIVGITKVGSGLNLTFGTLSSSLALMGK